VATLLSAGYKMEKTNTAAKHVSGARQIDRESAMKGESAELQRAWYQGQVAKFFSFEEASLSGGNVPLSRQST
jgi:hypothetical protein